MRRLHSTPRVTAVAAWPQWVLYHAGRVQTVQAPTRSEARARMKRLVGVLPAGAEIARVER